MYARGMHINSLNEELAVRKSGAPVPQEGDVPYNSSSGGNTPREVTDALYKSVMPNIDDLMAQRQVRD